MDMTVKDLYPHPMNPNEMDEDTQSLLSKSMKQFGNLSDIVFNVRDKTLASGHHRVGEFPEDTKIEITQEFKEPDDQGTIGYGFINYLGSIYQVRLVDWDEPTHEAAMIAANKIHGKFNTGKLSDLILKLDSFNIDMDLTGFTMPELERLMAPIEEVNKGDEMSEWVNMPEFKEMDKEIKIMLVFKNEVEREDFVRSQKISIGKKLKTIWICHY